MRILMVEDERVSEALLKGYLKADIEWATAKNGSEALTLFSEALSSGNRFQLVFLDLLMPGMSGHEVLKVLRGMESAQGIEGLGRVPVIITTSRFESRDIMAAFREGAEGYLLKPVRKDKLAELLTKVNLHGALQNTVPQEILPETRIFLVESIENLDALEADLLRLEQGEDPVPVIPRLFRGLHTMKGNCGFLGFNSLESLCHSAESLLGLIRDNPKLFGEQHVPLFLEVADLSRTALALIESSGVDDPGGIQSLCQKLDDVRRGLESLN